MHESYESYGLAKSLTLYSNQRSRGLAGYATVALASILDPSGGLFSDAARPCQRPAPPLWRERGTRKSRLETKTENEASSALLARLWCHLILQNRANGAENLTRLCSATIGQTGWRMVQVGAIRSRLETTKNRELTLIAKSSKHENAKQPHWAQARSSCWGTRSPPL